MVAARATLLDSALWPDSGRVRFKLAMKGMLVNDVDEIHAENLS